MNSWPYSKAWRTLKMLGKTERPDLLLPGPVALRVNGLLKISPTLQPLLSLFLSLSIVPLRCFNQVHCQIIRRRGGVFPFHFLEGASQILAHSGLWELLSKSTPVPFLSTFLSLFTPLCSGLFASGRVSCSLPYVLLPSAIITITLLMQAFHSYISLMLLEKA